MTPKVVVLLCRITIAVAATIIEAIEPSHPHIDEPLPDDFHAWASELQQLNEWDETQEDT